MAKITKDAARKILGDVPGEKHFWCTNGQVFRNLAELETALRNMSDETFRYHSSDTKSDFSNWVRDVIGDAKLSSDIHKCASAEQTANTIESRISWLKSK